MRLIALFCLGVGLFAFSSARAADDLAPIRLHLMLSSQFRATLDSKKMKALTPETMAALSKMEAQLGKLTGVVQPPTPATPIAVQPVPNLVGHLHVTGMTPQPFRLLAKPHGVNEGTIDSILRGEERNGAGIITLEKDELPPAKLGVYEFAAGGRRYAVIWNRKNLSDNLNLSMDEVDKVMPVLAKRVAMGMKLVVHDKDMAPHEIRRAADEKLKTIHK